MPKAILSIGGGGGGDQQKREGDEWGPPYIYHILIAF